MTKEYIFQALKNESTWEVGDEITFEVLLHQRWEFTLRREDEIYKPYKYSLKGKKVGTNERFSKRYRNLESVFLHILNNLNQNVDIKNKYKTLEDYLFS